MTGRLPGSEGLRRTVLRKASTNSVSATFKTRITDTWETGLSEGKGPRAGRPDVPPLNSPLLRAAAEAGLAGQLCSGPFSPHAACTPGSPGEGCPRSRSRAAWGYRAGNTRASQRKRVRLVHGLPSAAEYFTGGGRLAPVFITKGL